MVTKGTEFLAFFRPWVWVSDTTGYWWQCWTRWAAEFFYCMFAFMQIHSCVFHVWCTRVWLNVKTVEGTWNLSLCEYCALSWNAIEVITAFSGACRNADKTSQGALHGAAFPFCPGQLIAKENKTLLEGLKTLMEKLRLALHRSFLTWKACAF